MSKKVMIEMAFIMSILTLSVLTFFGATESKAKTSKDTSPFEYTTVSEGDNNCRITEIRIKKDKGISELKIPDTIDGKTVVSIGKDETVELGERLKWNAFLLCRDSAAEDGWTNRWSDKKSQAQKQRARKIEKIILPDTIKEIKAYAFAGLKKLKSIKLSKNLTTIGSGAFFITSIRKIHFPSSLTSIGTESYMFLSTKIREVNIPEKLKDGVLELAQLTDSWKSFTVSKKNPYYKAKKGILYSKDGKTLYTMLTSMENVRIPDTVKTIKERAFWRRTPKTVYLGAGVSEIQLHALSIYSKCKVTISPKNPYLARSGMCIYHKKNRNLLVCFPKQVKTKKGKYYMLKIPKKVKKLGKTISKVGVGGDIHNQIKKLYYPKSFGKLPDSGMLSSYGLTTDHDCKFIKY